MMETIDTGDFMGDIVTALPQAARVFGRYGLDYCCGGRERLGDACARAGLDAARLIREILEECSPDEPAGAWRGKTLGEVVAYILDRHHAYTKSALRDLAPLMAKVAAVHGAAHPELHALEALLERLKSDMEVHMLKEEHVLFPFLVELDHANPGLPPFGTIANPIRMMTAEHETDGAILLRMRDVTGEFALPPDACTSYRALYAGLRELVEDLMQHIHLENHVLFPMALAREREARAE